MKLLLGIDEINIIQMILLYISNILYITLYIFLN